MNNKTIIIRLSYELKYYVDLGECYPPRLKAEGRWMTSYSASFINCYLACRFHLETQLETEDRV